MLGNVSKLYMLQHINYMQRMSYILFMLCSTFVVKYFTVLSVLSVLSVRYTQYLVKVHALHVVHDSALQRFSPIVKLGSKRCKSVWYNF